MDLDYEVVVGDLGDPDTYKRVHAEQAALVVAGANDMMNTNIAFAVREVSEKVVWVLKDLRKLFHLLKYCIIVNRKPSTNGWLSRCTGTIGHA